MAAPFATVERGQQAASAGDTVWIRGGVYMFSGTSDTIAVGFSKAGGTNDPIKYFAYPGETPIFDLYNLKPQARVTGLDVHTNWIHVRGLEVRHIQQQVTGDCWSVRIQGNNNVLENLNTHHGAGARRLHHQRIEQPRSSIATRTRSYDPLGGRRATATVSAATPAAAATSSGAAGPGRTATTATISSTPPAAARWRQSWSWSNGYQPGTMTAAGNGAGFKAGGYGSPPSTPSTGAATHNVRQCLRLPQPRPGLLREPPPGRINFYNNTAINNPANFNMTADSGYPSSHDIKNNVATGSGGTITALTGGTATTNSWQVSGITVNASDFVNQMETEASQPRQADGSLPNIGVMHLAAGSDLIDKGETSGCRPPARRRIWARSNTARSRPGRAARAERRARAVGAAKVERPERPARWWRRGQRRRRGRDRGTRGPGGNGRRRRGARRSVGRRR